MTTARAGNFCAVDNVISPAIGTPNAMEIRSFRLTFATPARAFPILRDINLDIKRGEFLGIVGESGSGKSTLLFSIMNYLPEIATVESGAILYDGEDILSLSKSRLRQIRGRKIAMVYQDPTAALTPSMRVGQQVAEVRAHHFGESETASRRAVFSKFRAVGLEDVKRIYDSYPHELSGGQRQRVVLAMALAGEPDILLLDEPTTALDVVVQSTILDTLRHLQQSMSMTAVIVSHNLGVVASVADRVAVMYAGQLVEIGATTQVLRAPQHSYTKTLVSAVPTLEARSVGFNRPLEGGRAEPLVRATTLTDAIPDGTRPTAAVGPSAPDNIASYSRRGAGLSSPAHILSARDLTINYGTRRWLGLGEPIPNAVEGVSFDVRSGATLALVGESGSGKSSIARALMGLAEYQSGSILFNQSDMRAFSIAQMRAYRQRVQMVFQNPAGSLNPSKTVEEIMSRPMLRSGTAPSRLFDEVTKWLESVELDHSYAGRFAHELSGGEKQRVAIARVFATRPTMVLLDEPTTALDVSVQAEILHLLKKLQQETGCGYLLISHDLAVVRQIADEVVILRNGTVRETGPVEDVFGDPKNEYTITLLDSALKLDIGAVRRPWHKERSGEL